MATVGTMPVVPPMPRLTPVVLMGPSGVGKGTLKDMLVKEFPDDFEFSVSSTTRAPRPGEVEGVHYHFLTHEAMEQAIQQGEFLEHARVHRNIYGTSAKTVERTIASGRICLLDIDVQGGQQVLRSPVRCVFVFIEPPSMAELERRLRDRGTETEESVQTRMANARREMEASREPGFVDHRVVNDGLEAAYAELRKIVMPLVEQRRQYLAALANRRQ
eukprot:m51a1_g11154 guanylate kinase, putative (217) ;mRNA; f:254165-255129